MNFILHMYELPYDTSHDTPPRHPHISTYQASARQQRTIQRVLSLIKLDVEIEESPEKLADAHLKKPDRSVPPVPADDRSVPSVPAENNDDDDDDTFFQRLCQSDPESTDDDEDEDDDDQGETHVSASWPILNSAQCRNYKFYIHIPMMNFKAVYVVYEVIHVNIRTFR